MQANWKEAAIESLSDKKMMRKCQYQKSDGSQCRADARLRAISASFTIPEERKMAKGLAEQED